MGLPFINHHGECHIWTGPTTSTGTPRTTDCKSPAKLAFAEMYGREPLIRNLVRLCDTPLCVSAVHLADCIEQVVAYRSVQVESGCLEWTGHRQKGYGYAKVGGVNYRIHRWAWERSNGPIPDDLVIDHLCNNPACLNVEHLRCVTQGENGRAPHSNSPAGVNMRKTHCLRGHPFDEANTYWLPSGRGRACIACRKHWPSQRPGMRWQQEKAKRRRDAAC